MIKRNPGIWKLDSIGNNQYLAIEHAKRLESTGKYRRVRVVKIREDNTENWVYSS